MKVYYEWIDYLKGIAILGVIAIHTGMSELSGILGKIGTAGARGVQLFYIISSFLAYMSISEYYKLKRIAQQEKGVGDKKLKWWTGKWIRIAPLFYLAIFTYFITVSGYTYWLGSEEKISFFNILSHLTFTHNFFAHFQASILGVESYIGNLMTLYLVMPCLYRYINSLEKSLIAFCGVSFISYISFWGYNLISNMLINNDKYLYDILVTGNSFLSQFPVMLLGVVLYHCLEQLSDINLKKRKMLGYTLCGVAIIEIIGLIRGNNNIWLMSSYTEWGLVFFIAIVGIYLSENILINNRFFRYMGKNSYPIYLFHMLVIYFWDKWIFYNNINNTTIRWLIKFLGVTIVTSVLSSLITKYYEKPIVKFLKKINNNKHRV